VIDNVQSYKYLGSTQLGFGIAGSQNSKDSVKILITMNGYNFKPVIYNWSKHPK